MSNTLPIPKCIRCFSVKEDGVYVACTLEFGLAAQGDTRDEAVKKLEAQIFDYLRMALGDFRSDADRLLRRRAPLSHYVRYHTHTMLGRVSKLRDAFARRNSFEAFYERTPPLAIA